MIIIWTGMDSRSDEQSSTKPEPSGSEPKPTALPQWPGPRVCAVFATGPNRRAVVSARSGYTIATS
jgi:hypothetical protein